MATELITVPFHGNSLYIVEIDGQPYTPMKPIVEGMGMAWQTQHRKLNDSRFKSTITEMVIVAEDGKQREMTCLPLRKLPGWLMTIHAGKVRPEIRDKIVTYQNECDDALWDYWTKGEAKRHVPAAAPQVREPSPFAVERVLLERNPDGTYTSTKLPVGTAVIEMLDIRRIEKLVGLISDFVPAEFLPELVRTAQKRLKAPKPTDLKPTRRGGY